MSSIRNKIIEKYSLLQTKAYYAKESCKKKDGQAVMEYAIIFFIAGMGMAVSLSYLQTNIEASIYRQGEQLIHAGKTLF